MSHEEKSEQVNAISTENVDAKELVCNNDGHGKNEEKGTDSAAKEEGKQTVADTDGRMYIVEKDGDPSTQNSAGETPQPEAPSCSAAQAARPISGENHSEYPVAEGGDLPAPKRAGMHQKTAKKKTDGNGKAKETSDNKHEKLPSINSKAKSKSDNLLSGRNALAESKKSHSHRGVSEHDADARRTHSAPKIDTPEYKKKLMSALRSVRLTAAREHFEVGDKDAAVVKNANVLFETLSMRSKTIGPEALHNHLVLFTPPGVAQHEAHNFFSEECNGKKELDFPNFLRYGECLQKRILAFSNFNTMGSQEKIKTIATRVLPSPITSKTSEMLDCLIKLLENEEKDGAGDRPLRVYERLFLDEIQKKPGTLERCRGSSTSKVSGNSNRQRSSSDSPPQQVSQQGLANGPQTDEDISWEVNGTGNKAKRLSNETGKKQADKHCPLFARTDPSISGNRMLTTRKGTTKLNTYDMGVWKNLHSTENAKKGSKAPWNTNFCDTQSQVYLRSVDKCNFHIGYEERRRKDNKLIQLLEQKYNHPKVAVSSTA